jgi:hypothetical protein
MLKDSSGLANRKIAADNTIKVDILSLKYGILFIIISLLWYGLHLFNNSSSFFSVGVSTTSIAHLLAVYCCEPIVTEPSPRWPIF